MSLSLMGSIVRDTVDIAQYTFVPPFGFSQRRTSLHATTYSVAGGIRIYFNSPTSLRQLYREQI